MRTDARSQAVSIAARADGQNIRYRARVCSTADASVVAELLRRTDAVAEVHNTLRAGVAVELLP